MEAPVTQIFFLILIAVASLAPIVIITRNMFKKLLINDMRLATLGKKRFKGQVIITENEKKKPKLYKGRIIYAIHLTSKTKDLPNLYLNHYDHVNLYNLFELYTILDAYELNQLIEVEYVKKPYFRKEAVIVSIDGFPLRGKKVSITNWFGLAMMLIVCFSAVIAILILGALLAYV